MKRRDDEGAVLIMVLIAVSVIAVVLGALLSYADTSLRATIALRDVASTGADADGAVQAAINNIRNGTSTASGTCFGSSNTLSLPSFDGSTSAAVTCSSDPSSAVRIQCPSLTNCNRPGNAILTLGKVNGEDGLKIGQPNSAGSAFRVHGSVYSKSTINVASGSLTASSSVYAEGACSGSIQSTPAPSCSSAASPLGADPGYTPSVTAVPVHRSIPTCSGSSVVTFLPGYYDDAVGLSNLMDGSKGNGSCAGSTWWFKPGSYYFDFHNDSQQAGYNPLLPAGSDVWTVNDGKLVAGDPIGTLSTSTAIPGACDNPINDSAAAGVQFIFGGDSQLVVKAGQAEICGGWNFNTSSIQPPVAVYGLTSGYGSAAPVTTTNLTLTSVVPNGDFTNASPASLGTTGDSAGNASFTSTNKIPSGSVTVDGFAPAPAIPAGSILKSATLRVVHRLTLAPGNGKGSGSGSNTELDPLTVTITPSAGPARTITLPGAAASTAWLTDQTSLVDTTTGHLADSIYKNGFTGARIAASVGPLNTGDTEAIDAIQLDLSYVAPSMRAETGCVTAFPYTGTSGSSSACAVVTTLKSPGSQFYVQGTTYTPKAALDISLNNASEQVFRFGVISRTLQIQETGSFSFGGAVIEVPDDAPGFAYATYLTAYVCPGAATCTTTGTPVLRAKVAIVDANPAAPIAGKRQISILNWTPTG